MLLVDQCLSDIFYQRERYRSRSHMFSILDTSIHFEAIRGRSLTLSEIAPNFESLWLQMFLEGLSKICDLNCRTEQTFTHVPKFYGCRPSELRDLTLKKPTSTIKTVKHNTGKRCAAVPGGLIKLHAV